MQSLLQKVEKIEADAQQQIKAARNAGARKVNKLLAEEEAAIEEVRSKAADQGKAIVKEKVSAAKGSLNALHQEEEKSVTAIHDAAAKNRSQAVQFVIDLFRKEYLA